MKITLDEIKYLERLSALSSPDEKLMALADDFNNIKEFVEQVKNADIKEELKFENVHSLSELRKDEPKPSIPVSEVLENAPESANGYFVVPKVVN